MRRTAPSSGASTAARRADPIGVVRALPIREAWVPALVDVDGDRALIVEARPEPDGPIRAFLLDSVAGLVPIPWARASAQPIEISGGFAAASMAGPNRVAVLDLATGAELVTVPLPDRERGADLSLAPDGRVAVATQAGVTVAGPGAAARLVPGTKGLERVHLAGETLSGIDKTGRAVALPVGGGRITALGPPTRVFVDAAGDASGYAWIANGCAHVAAIPVSTAPTRSSDPCPTTEIAYAYIASTRLRGRTITVPVGCVAAPRGVCRGTAIARIFEGDGKAAATGRFAIPVGKSREVKLRVTRAALAEFRREGYGNLVMDARIPNGRIGAGGDGSAELGVDLPGRDGARRARVAPRRAPRRSRPRVRRRSTATGTAGRRTRARSPSCSRGSAWWSSPGPRGHDPLPRARAPGVRRGGPPAVHVGQPVTLPAEPGTYTFPAPHVFADYRSVIYGIEQETGGHAIAAQIRCSPEDGEGDVCNCAVRRRLPPAARRRGSRPPHRERRPARPRADDRADHRARRRPRRRRRRDRGPHEPARLRDHAAPERTPARVRRHGRERRAAHRRPPAGEGRLPSEPGPRLLEPGLRRECSARSSSGGQQDDSRDQYCRWRRSPSASGEPCGSSSRTWGSATRTSRSPPRAPTSPSGDQSASPEVRGPRPPLSLEVRRPPAVDRQRHPRRPCARRARARVRLQLRRGSRTYTRTITLRRAGKRDVVLRPPRRLAREQGLVTLTARSARATARARLQLSY